MSFDCQLSQLSSLPGELDPEDCVPRHYKEAYRLAIYALVNGGEDAYRDFLRAEQMGNFLSEQELLRILENVEQPAPSHCTEEIVDDTCSSGSYWPVESDLETPDLDLGWPMVMHENTETNINLLFQPPRQNCPTIKEVIAKLIQEAKQVIAIVMDIFTDVDIFKEIVEASIRGIAVYVLLDDFHIKSFLTMAEQQDVQIQRLKNMRVRTVKGLGYLCRSGAKFHGAMEQKFILVDCQTVVYGSYSFMWSYEKINLSLVQVITGQLVRGFDEQFRVLFARSTVPTESMPPDGKHNGATCAPRITQPLARMIQPNRILDMAYKRAYRKEPSSKNSTAEVEVKLHDNRSLIGPCSDMQIQLHQLKGLDMCDFLNRDIYGGERQESVVTPNQSIGTDAAGNRSAIRDGGVRDSLGKNDYLCRGMGDLRSGRPSQHYVRDISKRRSYHGIDKQVLLEQEGLPSWEPAAKSCVRTWRIKSYLSNTDLHNGNLSEDGETAGAPCDGPDSRTIQYIPSRLRSSIVFKSTIPEDPESSIGRTSTSTTLWEDQCGSSTGRLPYTSMRWNPGKYAESRLRRDDYNLKRHSFHTLDQPLVSKNMGLVRNPYRSICLNLDRTRSIQSVKNPDVCKEDSLAEIGPSEEPSSGRVSGLSENGETEGSAQTTRTRDEIPPLSHRSVSHCDIRNIVEKNNPLVYNWEEPPSKAVSTANLSDLKEPNFDAPFFKNGPKKIKTLLNIPEKSDSSALPENGLGLKTGSGSREEDKIPSKENNVGATSSSIKSGSSGSPIAEIKLSFEENNFPDKTGESSTPCQSAEQLQPQAQSSLPSGAAAAESQRRDSVQSYGLPTATDAWRRDPRVENRVYSRYEPFCTFIKKPSEWSTSFTSPAQQEERQRSLLSRNPRSGFTNERQYNNNDISYRAHARSENRFGRFMQRVGNLIHKNK